MEFIETYKNTGTLVAIVKNNALPKDYLGRQFAAKISVEPNGSAMLVTRANGDGSTRYRYFRSYAEAQQAAIKWAKRKIAEHRRKTI
jgi:hypothetical protein